MCHSYCIHVHRSPSIHSSLFLFFFFFFNDTATTEIYTLSLHDALPISFLSARRYIGSSYHPATRTGHAGIPGRSEEHTSELQSRGHLVCRLLLEKKKAVEEYRCISSSH